ncbi:MAG: RNA polymerase sigma factor [Bacteroidales bacterium]|nr:RNA polymerase sigma factor [Bacteroidales bacterium]
MPTQQQEIEFGDLLNRNSQTINSICLRYCGGNAFYFDELRQECAVAIWAEFSRYGLDRFRGDSAESTWIYQISYHAVIDYLRNPNHQEFQTVCDLYSLEYLTDNPSLNDWNLFDEITVQLNLNERNPLDHYLNDDSYSTIARTEGISESNARKRMSRLLNKLKMLIHK